MKNSTKTEFVRQAERGHLTSLGKVLGEMADPTGPTPVPTFTVATVPSASNYPSHIIYVSDGAAGSAILAFSDGTNWKRSDTGATIAAA